MSQIKHRLSLILLMLAIAQVITKVMVMAMRLVIGKAGTKAMMMVT